MTFNEYVVKYCTNRGMWPDQAEKVLENMRQTQATIGFDDLRWQDHIEGYPPMLMIGFGLNIKTAALKFIDETIPQAFFRPLFAD